MTATPYHEKFPAGTSVRIADVLTLQEFRRSWQYHNKLEERQLGYHDQIAVVKQVGFYHGGDALYELEEVPGIWHECCLRLV